MELLLNYMYQGEVNVAQEKLPVLLKAAEALQIKGIAVPDELPSNKEPLSKKRRRLSTADYSQSKRRMEENESSPSESMERTNENTSSRLNSYDPLEKDEELTRIIKEERVDSEIIESHIKQEDVFVNFPIVDNSSSYIEKEQPHNVDIPFEVQSPSWSGSMRIFSLAPEGDGQPMNYIPCSPIRGRLG
ncbi:UNVERIFIED_CONTAM: hypothetical protein GTU68_027660 [Idotea baltica]|nr:hypothetical protein [Idotea baltica]